MIEVKSITGMYEGIGKKKVYGKITPRVENGRYLDVRVDLILRTEEEIAKFNAFILSLKDKD
jgi:hypothetical protein